MATFTESSHLALRELTTCRDLLAGASAWSAATPCEGWDVDALARHVAAVAWQQAEALHRAGIGVTEAPSWLQVTGSRDEVLAALDAAEAHLSAGVGVVDSDERRVPLPFGTLPAPIAAAGLVLEYGVHRADLERALTGAPDDQLDADVAATVARLLPLLLPLLADKEPPAPVTYRLVADSATASITWAGDRWTDTEGDSPVCEVRGSDAAISLLALGRIPADHPSLAATDPIGAASALPSHIRPL